MQPFDVPGLVYIFVGSFGISLSILAQNRAVRAEKEWSELITVVSLTIGFFFYAIGILVVVQSFLLDILKSLC